MPWPDDIATEIRIVVESMKVVNHLLSGHAFDAVISEWITKLRTASKGTSCTEVFLESSQILHLRRQCAQRADPRKLLRREIRPLSLQRYGPFMREERKCRVIRNYLVMHGLY